MTKCKATAWVQSFCSRSIIKFCFVLKASAFFSLGTLILHFLRRVAVAFGKGGLRGGHQSHLKYWGRPESQFGFPVSRAHVGVPEGIFLEAQEGSQGLCFRRRVCQRGCPACRCRPCSLPLRGLCSPDPRGELLHWFDASLENQYKQHPGRWPGGLETW